MDNFGPIHLVFTCDDDINGGDGGVYQDENFIIFYYCYPFFNL